VLSGFVLYPQLKKVYEDNQNLKIFYLRRWLRTIPIFIVALLCYSIIFSKFDSDTLKYLFFIQKIKENFLSSDYFSVAWSLSIEEFFYLIFPLMLISLKRINFLKILLVFVMFIYLFKLVYLFHGHDEEFYRTGTFLRLDSIAFGVLCRLYFEKIQNINLNILFLAVVMLILEIFFSDLKNLNSLKLFIFVFLSQVISINAIIIFIRGDKILSFLRLKSFFSLLAKQTYSIYLFHFLIIYLISINPIFLGMKFLFIFYIGMLFILSSLCYYFFERKIIENRPRYN
tara:strand:- start:419 stop:1273 length:855 start_codon:yes stop_codon:yes gene_type:complete